MYTISDSFYDTTEDASEFSISSDSGAQDLSQMDPEAKAKLEEEWTRELAKVFMLNSCYMMLNRKENISTSELFILKYFTIIISIISVCNM